VQKLDSKTSGAVVRASQIIGANIQTPAGEGVGEVNDLVLDATNGQIRYAAVTYGGFLGVGNKLFAVPWQAFECQHDPDDPDEYHVVLDVTEQQLEGAQGFDQDHWPNFADRQFTD
jgi:sporulation protein YlmC with PRC-barrel domain